MLPRRIHIRLAGPVVAQRFFHSSISLFGDGVSNVTDTTTQLFVDQESTTPLLSLAKSGEGLASGKCMTFAFWPYPHEAATEENGASEASDAFWASGPLIDSSARRRRSRYVRS